MAFTPSQLALLMDLVRRHKENMTRKTLKCLEMSLESKDRNGYEGRFRCAHCDNEYTSIEMSDPELKYLKQIIDHIWCSCIGVPSPYNGGGSSSNTDDSTKHRLMDVLSEPPIPDVGQVLKCYSRGEIYETLHQCPDIHIREFCI